MENIIQLMTQKEQEFMEYMQGAVPRDENKLEFAIIAGQIDRAFSQAIAYETGLICYS